MSFEETPNGFWWEAKGEALAGAVMAHLKYMEGRQGGRREMDLRHVRLFGNREFRALDQTGYANVGPTWGREGGGLTWNVIRACCETVTARIARARPVPTFLTIKGDYTLRRKAEKLDRFVNGVLYKTDAYTKGQRVHLDSTVVGTGFLKVSLELDPKAKKKSEQSTWRVERVLPWEILTDDRESLYGEPRSMHQRKLIDRRVLVSLFGGHGNSVKGKAILAAAAEGDQVVTVESWCLPSGRGRDDGRHCIVIDGCVLLDEPWKHDWFPIVALPYGGLGSLVGFWGQGVAEQLTDLQREINRLLKRIERGHSFSVPKWFVERSSKINKTTLNATIGDIVEYQGRMPELKTFQTAQPEIYAHLERLYEKAFQILGVSKMSAAQVVQPGFKTGAAIRELNDNEAGRFALLGQAYEKLYEGLAVRIIEMAKDAYGEGSESGVDVSVSARVRKGSRQFIETIPWSEIDLDEDAFEMRVYSSAFLPHTPAGRLEKVQELIEGGFFSKEVGLRLLDWPDVDAEVDMATAAIDDVDATLEHILDTGEYLPPEPFQKAETVMPRALSFYLRARVEKVPEDRLDLLRRFLTEADAMFRPTPEAPPPPAPGEQGQPAPGPAEGPPGTTDAGLEGIPPTPPI